MSTSTAAVHSQAFRHSYVILLCSAVWSIPAELIWEMPASTAIAFFMGHDEGGLGGQHVDWRTVGGGSISYVRKAIAAIGPEVRLGEAVSRIHQEADGVTVTTDKGSEKFDYVVVGAHADEALAMLDNPTERQHEVLSKVEYNSSKVILHTDPSVVPEDKSRWEAWNYGKVEVGRTAQDVCRVLHEQAARIHRREGLLRHPRLSGRGRPGRR